LQSKLFWMNNCEASVSFAPIGAFGAVAPSHNEVVARVKTIEDEIVGLRDMLKPLQRRFDRAGERENSFGSSVMDHTLAVDVKIIAS